MKQPMKGCWAVCLPWESVGYLGRLRLIAHLTICEYGENVWLQGEAVDETLDTALRELPGAQRFTVLPDRQLLAVGHRVPQGYLPDAGWQPLAEWLTVTLEPASLAGQ